MAKKKTPPLSPEALEFFKAAGARGGKLGAKARMEKLSPEERSRLAKIAVDAREAQRKKKKVGK